MNFVGITALTGAKMLLRELCNVMVQEKQVCFDNYLIKFKKRKRK